MELELFCECPSAPHGLAVDGRGRLLVCVPDSGTVQRVDEEAALAPPFPLTPAAQTGGSPAGAALDADGVLFIADQAHQAVLVSRGLGASDSAAGSARDVLVSDHEDSRLLGPHSLAFTPDGTLIFSDPGPEGETGLTVPRGSVFAVTSDGQLLRPLALSCLARPSGVCVSPSGRCVFVCETGLNRIVRFVQRPEGVWHSSVFVQFSGLLGPVALAVDPDSGDLYVGRCDIAGAGSGEEVCGMISTVNAEGHIVEEVATPHPEISGLAYRQEGGANFLYISEASSRSVFRLRIVPHEEHA